MHGRGVGGCDRRAGVRILRASGRDRDAELLARLAELRVHVLPLADAQVVQELLAAHAAEGVSGALLLLLAQVGPEPEVGEEVARGVAEPGVQLIGLRLLVDRPLARVLDGERGGDHEHLVDDALLLRLEHHAPQPRVEWEPREAPADLGQHEVAPGLQRPELAQQVDAVLDRARVGRLDEREALDVA